MAWLSGWAKRVKLTIDQGDIDAVLSNFPILLYLSTVSGRNADDISFVFDELGSDANRKKIAVTTSDGETQCYVEIEKWDDANEHAWLWVKVPSISDTVDTDLYLYFDATHADNDTYVGDTNSTPAENVWDSHFMSVWHLRNGVDTSHVYDSTSNNKDGTKKAATEPTETTGKIGDAQDFDGSNDFITFGDIYDFPYTAARTFELWVNPDVINTYQDYLGKSQGASPYTGWEINAPDNAHIRFIYTGTHWTTDCLTQTSDAVQVVQDVWQKFSVTYDNEVCVLFKNGAIIASTANPNTLHSSADIAAQLTVGARDGGALWVTDGTIDEVRISDIVRSDAWLKGSYESERDHLLDWGALELISVQSWSLALSPAYILAPQSSQGYPLSWSPAWNLAASLASEKNYPLSISVSALLDLLSQQSYPLGWTSLSSIIETISKLSQQSWPLVWQSVSSKGVIVWKKLTDTLLAAQKKATRTPYVEARVYDQEQGIKRLSWTRLYTGSEPDNHHGIAFDGEGSMHRIRADGANLYHQKVTTPSPASDYSTWTLVTSTCAGPCAIASYGGKVFIFYVTSDNEDLRMYYSTDYGASWTDALLSTLPANSYQYQFRALSASWWGTGNIVCCFATIAYGLAKVVLNTDTLAVVSQGTYEPSTPNIAMTYGLGSTYDSNAIDIIFAANEAATGYNLYGLYRSQLDSGYYFLAPHQVITRPASGDEDEQIKFQYPDCHKAATLADYETVQLTAVENYAGLGAYSRPLRFHLVKDTAWSESSFVEPRFFINLSSDYGLRITSTSDYYWMERPDAVLRAPRSPTSSLDISADILTLKLTIANNKPGMLALILDNHAGKYASPGSGSLAALAKRSEVVLKLGYKTTAGNEAVEVGRYWIDSWEYSSDPNQSTFRLLCLDQLALADAWTARYVCRWNAPNLEPATLWNMMGDLIARWGIKLYHKYPGQESYVSGNYYPYFLIRASSQGDTALGNMLALCPDGFIQESLQAYIRELKADEASCYTYGTDHVILKGEYQDLSPTTRTQVMGETETTPPQKVIGQAFDWTNLLLGIDNLQLQYDPNLEETDMAQKRADALLRHESQQAIGGQIIVPTNCGHELFDVVTVTDPRCGISGKLYRVRAIETAFDRSKGLYQQKLILSAR